MAEGRKENSSREGKARKGEKEVACMREFEARSRGSHGWNVGEAANEVRRRFLRSQEMKERAAAWRRVSLNAK